MPTILEHPSWPSLRPFFRAEAYDRDRNARGYARRRLEIVQPETRTQRAWLLGVTAPCVCCGRTMHPIRERRQWSTLYYAAACPLDVSQRCSRGKEAANEYKRVVRFLAEHPRLDDQRSLF